MTALRPYSYAMKMTTKIGLLLLATFSICASFAQAQEKPNIVYVMCDDLGYGDVQCLNPERGLSLIHI